VSCVEVAVIVDIDHAPDRRWLEVADVIITSRAVGPPQWIEATLRHFPGAAIAAMARRGGESLLGLRDGRLVAAAAPAAPLAAFLHGWLVAGNPVEALGGTRLGARGWAGLGSAVRIRVGRWDEVNEAPHLGNLDIREPFVDP